MILDPIERDRGSCSCLVAACLQVWGSLAADRNIHRLEYWNMYQNIGAMNFIDKYDSNILPRKKRSEYAPWQENTQYMPTRVYVHPGKPINISGKSSLMDQPSKVYRSHSPTACKLSHRTDSS